MLICSDSQSDGQSTSQPFPAGVYSIPTFLAAANTDCTRNPSTWRCFPYTVYDASPAMSAVTFFWNISHAAENNSFSISSSNPFSINFQNAVLSFLDADTPQERYHFSISIGQTIIPSTPISNDGTAAVCNFNSTVLEGNLYTRKPPDPRSTNTTSKDAESWAVWPHAVEVYQRVGGGPGIPSCYKTSNGQTMGKITEGLEPMPSNDICQCSYKNFDL